MRSSALFILLMSFGFAGPASALFLDANGYYGIRGEIRPDPTFDEDAERHQAFEHSFRFTLDGRLHEKANVLLELRLMDDLRRAYVGDEAIGAETAAGTETQDPLFPQYRPFTPEITKVYVRYAFDYCILEAGRRGRDWGMGIFLDSGTDPFETDQSIFDGVSCDVNIQKFQTLGFSFGFDKLQESNLATSPLTKVTRRGATVRGDDLDQLFLSIMYDDRKANQGASVTKQIGLYFAYITENHFDTSLKIIDLYTNLNVGPFKWDNEFIFRIGDSENPLMKRLGGYAPLTSGGQLKKNNMGGIAAAGKLEYEFNRSGELKGPEEFHEGNFSRHVLFADYAYAPGDADGYEKDTTKRPTDAKAFNFHRNFKPALILFDEPEEVDGLAIDGVYNPDYVMNAKIFGLGYRFENTSWGNFEAKILTAFLNEGMPANLKSAVTTRTIGYGGKDLGYELDLKYEYAINRHAKLGLNGAFAVGGDAWRGMPGEDKVNRYLIQSYLTFEF